MEEITAEEMREEIEQEEAEGLVDEETAQKRRRRPYRPYYYCPCYG